MSRYASSPADCGGFTLVELLVALTVLAMLLGVTMNSLGFSLKTSQSVEQNMRSSERLHLAHRALRRQIQQAVPLVRDSADRLNQLDFEGGPASVSFVARLSGMRSYPGLYRIKLAIEGSASIGSNDGRLVMYYRPYSGDQLSTRQVNDEVSIVVLDGFASASFDYRGAATAARADWVPEWRDASRLPDLVRLQFQDAHTGYATGPDLVVAVRSTTPSRLMR